MMKIEIKKNIIKRKCIATNNIFALEELLRFNFDRKNNIISLDIKNNKKGRGAYFYPTKANWEFIVNKKILNKTFKTAVSRETYLEITKQLEENSCLKKID